MKMESERTGFSFGFKSKKESSVLKTKSVLNDNLVEKEEIDFIKGVDEKEIKSVKEVPKASGPLVIPCIKKNKWQVPSEEAGDSVQDSITTSGNGKVPVKTPSKDLDSIAARAVIEQAQQKAADDENEPDPNFAIPLLMQNKVPDGFETDEKINTELRPTESTLDDYEEVPIEQFGLALLRGMGWKDGEGIGRNKKHVKVVEPQLRPKGMGLGADKSAVLQDKGQSRHKKRKPGDEVSEEELQLKRGTHCMITKGQHTDLYATIEALDEDNSRCVVKLSLSQELVTISQFYIKLVDKDEFNKYSRYLNKGKSDKYKEREAKRNGLDLNSGPEGKRSRTAVESHQHKDKHSSQMASSARDNRHESSSSKSRSRSAARWACPLLRVKIVDRKYKGGQYYSSKVVVEDVLPNTIVCKTDSGRLLEGLTEDQLETVIPREDNSHVMVVRAGSESKSQIAKILERDSKRESVTVQLLSDRSILLTLGYDDVCQYTGNVDHLLEY